MQTLGMPGGRFSIELQAGSSDEPQPQGLEQVEFLVSANPGQPLKSLAKVASGGELSRISLAIQVITAQTSRVPTLVFDEVDVGIGGPTAEVVGQLLHGHLCGVGVEQRRTIRGIQTSLRLTRFFDHRPPSVGTLGCRAIRSTRQGCLVDTGDQRTQGLAGV